MPIGLPVALALAAQAAPVTASAPPQAAAAATAPANDSATIATAEPCRPTQLSADTREIVICGEREQGYRIDPDILSVKRMRRGGRPVRPGPEGISDSSVCSIGPQGCQSAGINLMGAALTAAEMAKRVAEGKEIGSMFITDPQPTEYQLYLAAKRAREAKELEEAGKAVAKAGKAK